jgi:hypothetical protein
MVVRGVSAGLQKILLSFTVTEQYYVTPEEDVI